MKYFWHFFKSNIKYNKLELAISYSITTFVFLLFFYFKDQSKKDLIGGETLVSVAFYALLYAFFSNKKKFNLKYILSLPLSKSRLLLVKAASDVVFFVPSMALAFAGAKYSKFSFDSIALIVLLIQLAVLVSLYLFDSDIEQPRLENTRASFVNRLVYVRKMVDSGFMFLPAALVGAAIYSAPFSMAFKQYVFILCFFFVIALKYHRSLKLIKDESLSYFIFKRDAFKMGWKLSLFAAPLLYLAFNGTGDFAPSPYGNQPLFRMISSNQIEKIEEYLSQSESLKLDVRGKSGHTPVLAAIQEGSVEALDLLMSHGFQLAWSPIVSDKSYKGFYPPHLAALSNNPAMMEKLLGMKNAKTPVSLLDIPMQETKETPLMVAVNHCNNEMVDYLLEKGANPNTQNNKGETPLIRAVKKGCDASVALLLEYKALAHLEDKEGKTALEHMSKRDSMYYFLKRKSPVKPVERKAKRSLASEKKKTSLILN